MFKRLKSRFILLSMVLLFLLLFTVVCAMNLLNYYSVVGRADYLLSVIDENGGGFPEVFPDPNGNGPMLSPEIPYESRFFTVSVDTDGEITSIDTSKIVIIHDEDVDDYVARVLEKGRTHGFIEIFRYYVTESESGCRVSFLDCGRKLEAIYTFAFWSLAMSFLGYVAVSIVLMTVAHRIMSPVAQSYEKQKRFITDAGHELKTPLAIIRANADLLDMEFGENESIEEIRRQTVQMSELTADLVFLARMEESGQNHLTMTNFGLSEIIEECTYSFERLAASSDKTLAIDVQQGLLVNGNSKVLRQLCSILLDNAIKYSPSGSTVSVSLSKKGRYAALTVENTTATLIPEKDLEFLFERFYRTDSSRNSKTGGNGIGLSIAKSIVDAHSGRISASLPAEDHLQITATIPLARSK